MQYLVTASAADAANAVFSHTASSAYSIGNSLESPDNAVLYAQAYNDCFVAHASKGTHVVRRVDHLSVLNHWEKTGRSATALLQFIHFCDLIPILL